MSGQSQQADYAGSWQIADGNDHFNATSSLVQRLLGMVGTSTLVQVKAVTGGGVAAVGFVDVQPLVHQQDGSGKITPHGVIHNLPFFRLQGGANAVIVDPVAGDIGLAIISSRDISKVKATRAPAAPDSFRQHDLADGLYIGGYLNAAPTQYILMNSTGTKVVTQGVFEVQAASAKFDCAITATGDVTAGSISLQQHTHPYQPGSGSTTETGTPQG